MYLLFIFVFTIHTIQCARILGVFHTPGYSHFILGETIFKELASRGHEVTVVSCYPQKEKLKNYRDVYLPELNDFMNNLRNDKSFMLKFANKPAITTIIEVHQFGREMTDLSLKSKNLQNLLSSNQTFDLIILEQFLNEAHFGFMHRYKVPLVLIGTTSASIWTNTLTSNPTPFSYIPNMLLNCSPKMNFWQRAYNTFVSTFQIVYFYISALPKQDEILHKYFEDAPSIHDLMYNASLIMINSHPAIGAAIPLLPNMIEIGGFHVQKYKPLPENLKRFLDEAKEGVVYFSLGSNMQSKDLPEEKIQGILKAFSKINMKVLWKWEDDDLPGKPYNVRTEKWLPQPAVLAHENVKIFVTHGGRLSIIESIYFGKPIIGIPLFAEQNVNVQEAAYFGYGLYLAYNDLDEEHLSKALKEMIENPRYTEMAKFRSAALHDLQVTPLENAINWIEYVLKHKGVPHLRNAGINLAWYQYLLLDVALFCLTVVWVLKKIVCVIVSKRSKARKEKLKAN